MYIFHDVDETLVPQTGLPERRAEPHWKKRISFLGKSEKGLRDLQEARRGTRGGRGKGTGLNRRRVLSHENPGMEQEW